MGFSVSTRNGWVANGDMGVEFKVGVWDVRRSSVSPVSYNWKRENYVLFNVFSNQDGVIFVGDFVPEEEKELQEKLACGCWDDEAMSMALQERELKAARRQKWNDTIRNTVWDDGKMVGEALQPDGSWKEFSVPLYDFFTVELKSPLPVSGTDRVIFSYVGPKEPTPITT